MDFHGLKRRELQELCKKHGIRANIKNVEMADRLSALFHKEEEPEKAGKRGRPCLKNGGEGVGVISKEGKKVRFSPENQTFLFERTDPRAMRLFARKKRGFGNSREEENPVVISDNLEELDDSLVGVSDDVVRVKEPTGRRNLRRKSVVISKDAGLLREDGGNAATLAVKGVTLERNLRSRRGKDKQESVEIIQLLSPCDVGKENIAKGRDLRRNSRRSVVQTEVLGLVSDSVDVVEKSPVTRGGTKQGTVEVISLLSPCGDDGVSVKSRGRNAYEGGVGVVSLLSPCKEKKAKRGRKGKGIVEEGNGERVDIPADDKVDHEGKDGRVTKRQLRGRQVAVENLGGDDTDAGVSNCNITKKRGRRRKSARLVEQVKAISHTSISKGRGDTDEDVVETLAQHSPKMVLESKGRKRGRRTNLIVKHQDINEDSTNKPDAIGSDHLSESNQPDVDEHYQAAEDPIPMEPKTNNLDEATLQSSPSIPQYACDSLKLDATEGVKGVIDATPEIKEVIVQTPTDDDSQTSCLLRDSGEGGASKAREYPSELVAEADYDFGNENASSPSSLIKRTSNSPSICLMSARDCLELSGATMTESTEEEQPIVSLDELEENRPSKSASLCKGNEDEIAEDNEFQGVNDKDEVDHKMVSLTQGSEGNRCSVEKPATVDIDHISCEDFLSEQDLETNSTIREEKIVEKEAGATPFLVDSGNGKAKEVQENHWGVHGVTEDNSGDEDAPPTPNVVEGHLNDIVLSSMEAQNCEGGSESVCRGTLNPTMAENCEAITSCKEKPSSSSSELLEMRDIETFESHYVPEHCHFEMNEQNKEEDGFEEENRPEESSSLSNKGEIAVKNKIEIADDNGLQGVYDKSEVDHNMVVMPLTQIWEVSKCNAEKPDIVGEDNISTEDNLLGDSTPAGSGPESKKSDVKWKYHQIQSSIAEDQEADRLAEATQFWDTISPQLSLAYNTMKVEVFKEPAGSVEDVPEDLKANSQSACCSTSGSTPLLVCNVGDGEADGSHEEEIASLAPNVTEGTSNDTDFISMVAQNCVGASEDVCPRSSTSKLTTVYSFEQSPGSLSKLVGKLGEFETFVSNEAPEFYDHKMNEESQVEDVFQELTCVSREENAMETKRLATSAIIVHELGDQVTKLEEGSGSIGLCESVFKESDQAISVISVEQVEKGEEGCKETPVGRFLSLTSDSKIGYLAENCIQHNSPNLLCEDDIVNFTEPAGSTPGSSISGNRKLNIDGQQCATRVSFLVEQKAECFSEAISFSPGSSQHLYAVHHSLPSVDLGEEKSSVKEAVESAEMKALTLANDNASTPFIRSSGDGRANTIEEENATPTLYASKVDSSLRSREAFDNSTCKQLDQASNSKDFEPSIQRLFAEDDTLNADESKGLKSKSDDCTENFPDTGFTRPPTDFQLDALLSGHVADDNECRSMDDMDEDIDRMTVHILNEGSEARKSSMEKSNSVGSGDSTEGFSLSISLEPDVAEPCFATEDSIQLEQNVDKTEDVTQLSPSSSPQMNLAYEATKSKAFEEKGTSEKTLDKAELKSKTLAEDSTSTSFLMQKSDNSPTLRTVEGLDIKSNVEQLEANNDKAGVSSLEHFLSEDDILHTDESKIPESEMDDGGEEMQDAMTFEQTVMPNVDTSLSEKVADNYEPQSMENMDTNDEDLAVQFVNEGSETRECSMEMGDSKCTMDFVSGGCTADSSPSLVQDSNNGDRAQEFPLKLLAVGDSISQDQEWPMEKGEESCEETPGGHLLSLASDTRAENCIKHDSPNLLCEDDIVNSTEPAGSTPASCSSENRKLNIDEQQHASRVSFLVGQKAECFSEAISFSPSSSQQLYAVHNTLPSVNCGEEKSTVKEAVERAEMNIQTLANDNASTPLLTSNGDGRANTVQKNSFELLAVVNYNFKEQNATPMLRAFKVDSSLKSIEAQFENSTCEQLEQASNNNDLESSIQRLFTEDDVFGNDDRKRLDSKRGDCAEDFLDTEFTRQPTDLQLVASLSEHVADNNEGHSMDDMDGIDRMALQLLNEGSRARKFNMEKSNTFGSGDCTEACSLSVSLEPEVAEPCVATGDFFQLEQNVDKIEDVTQLSPSSSPQLSVAYEATKSKDCEKKGTNEKTFDREELKSSTLAKDSAATPSLMQKSYNSPSLRTVKPLDNKSDVEQLQANTEAFGSSLKHLFSEDEILNTNESKKAESERDVGGEELQCAMIIRQVAVPKVDTSLSEEVVDDYEPQRMENMHANNEDLAVQLVIEGSEAIKCRMEMDDSKCTMEFASSHSSADCINGESTQEFSLELLAVGDNISQEEIVSTPTTVRVTVNDTSVRSMEDLECPNAREPVDCSTAIHTNSATCEAVNGSKGQPSGSLSELVGRHTDREAFESNVGLVKLPANENKMGHKVLDSGALVSFQLFEQEEVYAKEFNAEELNEFDSEEKVLVACEGRVHSPCTVKEAKDIKTVETLQNGTSDFRRSSLVLDSDVLQPEVAGELSPNSGPLEEREYTCHETTIGVTFRQAEEASDSNQPDVQQLVQEDPWVNFDEIGLENEKALGENEGVTVSLHDRKLSELESNLSANDNSAYLNSFIMELMANDMGEMFQAADSIPYKAQEENYTLDSLCDNYMPQVSDSLKHDHGDKGLFHSGDMVEMHQEVTFEAFLNGKGVQGNCAELDIAENVCVAFRDSHCFGGTEKKADELEEITGGLIDGVVMHHETAVLESGSGNELCSEAEFKNTDNKVAQESGIDEQVDDATDTVHDDSSNFGDYQLGFGQAEDMASVPHDTNAASAIDPVVHDETLLNSEASLQCNEDQDRDSSDAQNVKTAADDNDKLVLKIRNRSIMIHGTPRKPPLPKYDMKENMPAPKRLQMVNATARKPVLKRKALGEI